MSDTGSSFAHWAAGLYDPADLSPDAAAGFAADDDGGSNSNNAVVAVPATSPTKLAGPGIEGPRVGKPSAARRRSRASRRAPVTLLNTDTANFRAMVQQFTGIPEPPPAAFGHAPVISFAAGGDYRFPPPAGLVSSSFDHHLRRGQQHPTPLHDQLIRRQQQYTGAASFGYNNNNGLFQGAGGGSGLDMFASAAAEDRMLLQSIQQAAAHNQMPQPTSAAHNTSLGFFA